MQRFYQGHEKEISNPLEITRRTAFHEAGHAAAIYLGNKLRNLPAIYFQIQIRKQNGIDSPIFTRIRGGRLVSELAMINPATEAVNDSDSTASVIHQPAYEADIINFLVGPLAEAKYVSIRDNEVFNNVLLTPNALNNYGGNADMKEVMSYLEFFIPSPTRRESKLRELFYEAYHFVRQSENWKSISALAYYIIHSTEENIDCEQAIEVLDQQHIYTDIYR